MERVALTVVAVNAYSEAARLGKGLVDKSAVTVFARVVTLAVTLGAGAVFCVTAANGGELGVNLCKGTSVKTAPVVALQLCVNNIVRPVYAEAPCYLGELGGVSEGVVAVKAAGGVVEIVL